ncbi:MAG: HAD-IIB family hydrolase [Cyanobacteria bacterium J06639_1]
MKKLLISTDLDATLLDHQNYTYEPALAAIATLQSRDCPIVFNSSKTLSEQRQLRASMGIHAPFIVENGAAAIIPAGQLDRPKQLSDDEIKRFGLPYKELVAKLHDLRDRHGYRFRGFSDLSAEEVARMTGLALQSAVAAKQRMGSEPLLWEDNEAAYDEFVARVETMGLQNTRGGRFRHVTARTDKGAALQWLIARYERVFPDVEWIVVALGDSPNDLSMLRVADIGVLISNPHRPAFTATGVRDLRQPEQVGPSGWAEAVTAIARELGI